MKRSYRPSHRKSRAKENAMKNKKGCVKFCLGICNNFYTRSKALIILEQGLLLRKMETKGS